MLATDNVSHFDSNKHKTLRLQIKTKYLSKHWVKKILRQEKYYIKNRVYRARIRDVDHLTKNLIEEWRLLINRSSTEQSNSGVHVADHLFVHKEDTLSISCG